MIGTNAGKEYSLIMGETISELEKAEQKRRSNNISRIINEHAQATNQLLKNLDSIRKERIARSRNGLIYHPPLEETILNLQSSKDKNPGLRLVAYDETKYEMLSEKLSKLGRNLLNYLF